MIETLSKIAEVAQKAGEAKSNFDPDAKVGGELSKSVSDTGKSFDPDAKAGNEVSNSVGDTGKSFDPDAKAGNEVSNSVGDAGKSFDPDAKAEKSEADQKTGDGSEKSFDPDAKAEQGDADQKTDGGSEKSFDPDAKAEKGDADQKTDGESEKTFDPDAKAEKGEAGQKMGSESEKLNDTDEKQADESEGDMRNCPIDGNNGHWDGERGNSTWIPDDNYVPEKANPDGLTWKEIKDKYGIEGIPFKNGEPDFSEITKGKVEIEGYSDSRPKNFSKADVEIAKQRGCSPSEVREWREKNGYTWHESKDCKTMSKVPNDVHLNVPHRGGISTIKQGA